MVTAPQILLRRKVGLLNFSTIGKQLLLKIATASLMLAVVLSPLCARASISSDITLGVTATDFDYREFDSTNYEIDSENGTLPGLKIGARVFAGSFFVGVDASYVRGEADYRADINGTLLRSTTDQTITNFAVSGGWQVALDDRTTAAVSAGYGERRWQRDIQSTSSAYGLSEDYHWPYFSLGVEGIYKLRPRHSLALSLKWLRTRNADISVDFKSDRYDATTFDLPEGDGYEVAVRWDFHLQPSLVFSISPVYRTWDIPRSNSFKLNYNGMTTNSLVTEPRSETEEIELVFSVTKRW
jgi:hypothetical protein